MLRGEKQP